jgi:hypothetical protein
MGMAGGTAGTIGTAALGAQAIGGIGETYASYRKSAGEKQGYEYQSQVARNNAKLAEWQAEDAIDRGVSTKQQIQMKKAETYGTQRATFASRNVALDEGSALNILTETLFMGARDEGIAEDNANKEAWALRNQAAGYESNASFLSQRAAQQNPYLDAAGTALTSAGRVASSWYTMRTRTDTSGASVWGK